MDANEGQTWTIITEVSELCMFRIQKSWLRSSVHGNPGSLGDVGRSVFAPAMDWNEYPTKFLIPQNFPFSLYSAYVPL